MITVNPDSLIKAIGVLFSGPTEMPLVIAGEPGTGMVHTIKQATEQHGIGVVEIRLTNVEPFIDNADFIKLLPGADAPAPTMVLLTDYTDACPSVKLLVSFLLTNGGLRGYRLPAHCRCVVTTRVGGRVQHTGRALEILYDPGFTEEDVNEARRTKMWNEMREAYR